MVLLRTGIRHMVVGGLCHSNLDLEEEDIHPSNLDTVDIHPNRVTEAGMACRQNGTEGWALEGQRRWDWAGDCLVGLCWRIVWVVMMGERIMGVTMEEEISVVGMIRVS